MNPSKVDVAVFHKSKSRNYYNGDSYVYVEDENGFTCAIADGLGSGEFASESSKITIDIIKHNPDATIKEIVAKCNKELMGKRGVVLGILKFNYSTSTYSYSSLGNIGLMIIDNNQVKKRNIPNSGYLAGYKRSLKVEEHPLAPEMTFIMFSDGVSDKDLSNKLFMGKNVNEVIDTYKEQNVEERKDDTTLIAVKYLG